MLGSGCQEVHQIKGKKKPKETHYSNPTPIGSNITVLTIFLPHHHLMHDPVCEHLRVEVI
jgi:hypothetical protein